jgi:hypothetical protein
MIQKHLANLKSIKLPLKKQSKISINSHHIKKNNTLTLQLNKMNSPDVHKTIKKMAKQNLNINSLYPSINKMDKLVLIMKVI